MNSHAAEAPRVADAGLLSQRQASRVDGRFIAPGIRVTSTARVLDPFAQVTDMRRTLRELEMERAAWRRAAARENPRGASGLEERRPWQRMDGPFASGVQVELDSSGLHTISLPREVVAHSASVPELARL